MGLETAADEEDSPLQLGGMLRRQTQRCAGGPVRQKLNDVLTEKRSSMRWRIAVSEIRGRKGMGSEHVQ